jgi:hypothetical protein
MAAITPERKMNQDYQRLTDDELEGLEKQTLRVIVQAIQEYSHEARLLFETTPAARESEVVVLAEDLVQYALEVAECYPINRRFAGYIDYKRVRWMPSPHGLFPQVLLVDAKASKENIRTTLQQSQLCMDAEFAASGSDVQMTAGVPPDWSIPFRQGAELLAVTTSAFIHFHYTRLKREAPPFRKLHAIYALLLPHQRLKPRYNPDPHRTFFGQGKHSPKRGEEPRIRVYFSRLRRMCPWRMQVLKYRPSEEYTIPEWRDIPPAGSTRTEEIIPFHFIGR